MADDFGTDDNVLAESAGGDVAAVAVSTVGDVCGVFEFGDCGVELGGGAKGQFVLGRIATRLEERRLRVGGVYVGAFQKLSFVI